MDPFLILLSLGALIALFLILWQSIAPKEDVRNFARRFFNRRLDGLMRIWRFAGPRLTHKPTVAMVIANAAILFGVDVQSLDQLTIAAWVGALLFFPPWDDLPVQKLEPASRDLA